MALFISSGITKMIFKAFIEHLEILVDKLSDKGKRFPKLYDVYFVTKDGTKYYPYNFELEYNEVTGDYFYKVSIA